jgi:hypothetical protein
MMFTPSLSSPDIRTKTLVLDTLVLITLRNQHDVERLVIFALEATSLASGERKCPYVYWFKTTREIILSTKYMVLTVRSYAA